MAYGSKTKKLAAASAALILVACGGAPAPAPVEATSMPTGPMAPPPPDLAASLRCGPDTWPGAWQDMVIEAKWLMPAADLATYEKLVTAFPDGGTREDYTLAVKWDGAILRYADIYYDTADGALGRDDHVLRHRVRAVAEPPPVSDSLEALDAAKWHREYERIQYKSTPTRLGAIWFRIEKGGCDVWNPRGGTCGAVATNVQSVLTGRAMEHPAMHKLRRDHPDANLATTTPVLEVVDYRRGVELKKGGETWFELTFDRIGIRPLPDGTPVQELEVELTLARNKRGKAELAELFLLAQRLQDEFGWTPSAGNKGGGLVPDACPAQAPTGS